MLVCLTFTRGQSVTTFLVSMETFDRDGRPLFLIKVNSAPDKWCACYLDIVWNGGWFAVYDEINCKG